MIDFNSRSAADADKLSRGVKDLVSRHLDALFDASLARPAVADLASQVASGQFSPLIEKIRGPVQGLAQREGLLIQGALTLALQATAGMLVFPTVRITVTESDRDLVSGNLHNDISQISPPRASDEVGRVEIDLLSIEPTDQTLWIIDCKRTPREKDRDRRHLQEASLAANRRLRRDGLICRKTRICLVRWYGAGGDFSLDPAVATSETVDELFGAPVRRVVDSAIEQFKDGVNTRVEALLARAMSAAPPTTETVRQQPTVPIADLESLRRALTSNRFGRRG